MTDFAMTPKLPALYRGALQNNQQNNETRANLWSRRPCKKENEKDHKIIILTLRVPFYETTIDQALNTS